MQIFNHVPFSGSIYSSLQEKISSVLNDKRNVIITLLAVSIFTILTLYIYIQRKAKFSKMHINVIDKDDQTTTVYKIERNETVGSLKTRLSQKMNVPLQEIELRKDGLHLNNDKTTFKEYGIQNHSTLTLIKGIEIFVRSPNGQTISYRVSEGDSVSALKTRLSQKFHLPLSDIDLRMNNVELEEDKKLKDYRIQKASRIQVISQAKTEQIRVSLQPIASPLFHCTVKRSDTIEALKKKIEKQEGTPVHQIQLNFAGQTLENDRTLKSYDIKNDSILGFTRIFVPNLNPLGIKPTQNINIFIQTLSSKTFSFQLSDESTIEALKKKIEEKESIVPHEQKLVFNGKTLENDRTLKSYAIKNDSQIHLIFTPAPEAVQDFKPAQNIQVFIKTLTGKTIPIQLLDTDTLETLMKKIDEKEGIPPIQQRLIFEGKGLEENRSLRSYNIKHDSSINLVLKLRGE